LVLVLAQVFPAGSPRQTSSRVGRYGSVEADGEAWPAVELLWGHAESVKVRARDLCAEPGADAKLLWEARGVKRSN